MVDGGARVVWDAGVTAVTTRYRASSFRESACAATAAGIRCIPSVQLPYAEPGPTVRPVSLLTMGTMHGCAWLDDGRTACWGNNQSGQLGNRSAQPLGLQLLPQRAKWIGHFEGEVLFEGATRVIEIQNVAVVAAPDDAGATWMRPATSKPGGTAAGYELGCPCALDAGSFCGSLGPKNKRFKRADWEPGPEADVEHLAATGGSTR